MSTILVRNLRRIVISGISLNQRSFRIVCGTVFQDLIPEKFMLRSPQDRVLKTPDYGMGDAGC